MISAVANSFFVISLRNLFPDKLSPDNLSLRNLSPRNLFPHDLSSHYLSPLSRSFADYMRHQGTVCVTYQYIELVSLTSLSSLTGTS